MILKKFINFKKVFKLFAASPARLHVWLITLLK